MNTQFKESFTKDLRKIRDKDLLNRAKAVISKKESVTMSSTAIVTMTKIMESLPEPVQDQVVDHLREYLEDLQDELQWDTLFKKTQPQLIAAARRAKQEIAQGLAKPMDYDQL